MKVGDVISYVEMCTAEGASLQRGMNFQLGETYSVVLMSVRRGAPYADRIEDDGRMLIYEGHDAPTVGGGPDPKTFDQPMQTPRGTLTQNGLFYRAAEAYKAGERPPELVKAYEKIMAGVWSYGGLYRLVDAWKEAVEGGRKVFKFRLDLTEESSAEAAAVGETELEHTRIIPAEVKREVWKRDGGRCVQCGAAENLHFDHIIPYSKGGSSLVAANVQLLCARHNLQKHDRIE